MNDKLILELKKFADPKKAFANQRYHKSAREHWGVTIPHCDLIAKQFAKDLKQDEIITMAEDLWMTDQFDLMMCSAKLLCLKKIKPSQKLWKTIKNFLRSVDGWALEDSLAHAAWKCILADHNLLNDLEKWTKAQDFWLRRATLVYTLPFAKPGQDPERMLGWASSYSNDPEWFMQKAIGWWLRVLGEHNPDRVFMFLQEHWPNLKTVAKKEATRKLSDYFQKKINLLN